MKRLLALLLALVPVICFAYDVVVDGIYYNVVKKVKTASVTNDDISYTHYSGDIVIPSSITVDGVEYSVTSIGVEAFIDCTSLTSIVIPSGVTSIEDGAFYGCTSLTSLEIPSSVTSIGISVFCGCTSLTTIEIPSSVTSIGKRMFQDCTSLTTIKILSNVTSIGDWMFCNCKSLTTIEIPSSVTSIGSNAFLACTSLTTIDIPSSVTSIGGGAFQSCTSLSSIEIPSSVTSIGSFAFSNCTSLTSIEIPSSFTSIGGGWFNDCTALTSIKIPYNVISIEGWAFSGCRSLENLEIPASVTIFGNNAFANCKELKNVYYYAKQLPESLLSWEPPTDIFNGSYVEYATLHVPTAVIDDFKATKPWSKFGNIVPTDDVVIPQCEAPTITYQAGKLKFTCPTEGAQMHYEIGGTQASSGSIEDGEIEIPTHITVTAYATANGYHRSETVTYQLPLNPGPRGDVNQDGEVTVADAVEVANIILEKEE